MAFNFRTSLALTFLAFSLTFALPIHAQTNLDFDDLNDYTPVTTQYSAEGVIFGNTTVITAGISLNELEFPPVSGSNVVFDDSGPIGGVFSTPVHSVSGYFTYTSPLIFTAFDSSGKQISSVSSLYSGNTVSSGNAPDEFLQLSSPFVISSFTIAGDPSGTSFTMDDMNFSPLVANPVPEASSAVSLGLLLLLALGGFYLRSRLTRLLHAHSRIESQTMHTKILPCLVAACLSFFLVLPARAIQSVATPTANADYVFVNEAQTVTLTAQVSPDPQLITTSVNLVRVSSTGTVLSVFPMYDDGTHGDKVGGDGSYTAQVSLNEQATGNETFYVTAAYRKSLLRAKSPPFNLRAVLRLNQDQITEYINTGTEAGDQYSALILTEPASQARTDLVRYLLTLPGVSSAGITPDGTTVYFMIFGNLEEDIETDLFGSGTGSSSYSKLFRPNLLTHSPVSPQTFSASPSIGTPTYEPLVGNRKALCIAAYHDEFSTEGGDETDTIRPMLAKACGVEPIYAPDNDATVDVFKTMSNYGIVVITSHGYRYHGFRNIIFGDFGVNIDTREAVTEASVKEHSDDVYANRIVYVLESDHPSIKHKMWAITPDFVRHYGTNGNGNGSYQSSLIYVGSCSSYEDDTMSRAFLDSGAKAYFGYNDHVRIETSYQDGTNLFSILANPMLTPKQRTAQIAFDHAQVLAALDFPSDPMDFAYDGLQPNLALNLIDHIVITPDSPSVAVGATLPLTATAYDSSGNVWDTPLQLQWSSSDSTKATVDANGVVTGVAAGTATITVTDSLSTRFAKAVVTVLPSLDHISANAALLLVGAKALLTGESVYNNPIPTTDIAWQSSDPSVATIDKAGNVTGIAVNPAVVFTATQLSTGKTATITFRVADILGHWVGKFTGPNESNIALDFVFSQRQDESLSLIVTVPDRYNNELFVQGEIGSPSGFDFLASQVALPYYVFRGSAQGNTMTGLGINPYAIFTYSPSPFTATRQ